MPEPIDIDEARAHAANYRGELSRLGLVTPMLIEALIAEVDRLRSLLATSEMTVAELLAAEKR